jgi:hypothetical protein
MGSHIAYLRTYSMARPLGAAATEVNLGLCELRRLAVSMAVHVAGIMSAIFESRPQRERRSEQPPAAPRISPRPIKPPPPEALPLLTEAIIGSSKFTIASVLGAPRSAVAEGLAAIEQSADAAFYQTDTWYYPLPRHGHIAMAVIFSDNVARRVEFFHAAQPLTRSLRAA